MIYSVYRAPSAAPPFKKKGYEVLFALLPWGSRAQDNGMYGPVSFFLSIRKFQGTYPALPNFIRLKSILFTGPMLVKPILRTPEAEYITIRQNKAYE